MKIIYIDHIYFEIVIVKENCKLRAVSRETKHSAQFRIVVNSVIPLLSYLFYGGRGKPMSYIACLLCCGAIMKIQWILITAEYSTVGLRKDSGTLFPRCYTLSSVHQFY